MSSKNTVLIVDDDATVCDALSVILSDSDYRAVVVTNGHDALMKADSEGFDAAIIDVGLPDMTGLELLAVLRIRDPALRIIIMTALPSPEILSEATWLGAMCVLVKPFQPSDVLDWIKMTNEQP
ncbi:MAG TPA: response regulator [Blastocatellia bacterium]|nr:response regulator [Blastocatellia bacterium]